MQYMTPCICHLTSRMFTSCGKLSYSFHNQGWHQNWGGKMHFWGSKAQKKKYRKWLIFVNVFFRLAESGGRASNWGNAPYTTTVHNYVCHGILFCLWSPQCQPILYDQRLCSILEWSLNMSKITAVFPPLIYLYQSDPFDISIVLWCIYCLVVL